MSITSGPDRALVDRQVHARAAVGKRQGGFHVRRVSWQFPQVRVVRASESAIVFGAVAARIRLSTSSTSGRASSPLGLRAREQQVEQVVVGQVHQRLQALGLRSRQRGLVAREEALDEQVVLEQAAAAAPAQAAQRSGVDRRSACRAPARLGRRGAQTARRTIISLILPIALVGFRPLGQTSTQFMMVWQRNSRYGSSRLSRRAAVSWSRLSAMKR